MRLSSVLDALACWAGRPRWRTYVFAFGGIQVCRWCGDERGSRWHQ